MGTPEREEVLGNVSAAAEGGLEFLKGEEDLLVVSTWVVRRLDVDVTDEAAVLAGAEVGSGAHVGLIEAQAGGAGDEGDAPAAARGDEGRALLGGSIHVRGNGLAVPVHLLGAVGLIVDVDGDGATFFEAQQRAGELAVVCGRGDDALGC
jgi:hypothetical protein